MATILRVSKAFRAMKDIGIGEDRTEPVLKKLLKLYEKNWELIEKENYRVLADAIFDEGNDKEEDFGEDIQVPDECVRPLKRLRLRGQEAQVSPFQNSTVSGLNETPLIIPKLEEAVFPETHPPQQLQLCAPKRSENDPSSSCHADKGREPVSPNMVARVKKSNMEKSSTALRIKEPAVVSGVKNHKVRASGAHTLIVPKDDPFTDDISTTVLPPYELPIAAIHTGSLPKDEPFTDDISTTILPPYELSIAAIHPDPSSKGDCAIGNNSVGKRDSEDARASHPLDGSNKVDSTETTQYKRSTSSELATVIEESHPNLPLEEVVVSSIDQRSMMSESNRNGKGLNDKGKRPMDMTRSIAPGNRKTPTCRSGVVLTEPLSDSPISPPSSTASSRHMSTSTSHEEDTLMPPSNCGNIATSGSSNKPPTRGWAKNNALRKKKSTDKKNVMIMPTINRVVGTDTRNFATEVGILVRQLIPPSHLTYEQVPPHILDHIRVRIADEFYFDLTNQEHWKVVDDQMKSSAKQFRYELGRAYHRNVLKFGDEARHMKLPRVERDEDWELLIKKWESKEFKNLSQQNIKSRKHLPYLHKGGSKSNANKFYEMRQEKPDTTWVDVFETQHSYQNDMWVSNLAKEQHQQMVQYMSLPETEDGSDTVESRQPLSDIDAMQKTLGDRSGYRRGIGRGPKPPLKSSASSHSFEPSQNELLTQEKLKEALQSIESFKKRELEREEEHKKLQEDMAVLMRFFKSQGGEGGGGGQGNGGGYA